MSLNSDKTELLIIGLKNTTNYILKCIGPLAPTMLNSVLGILALHSTLNWSFNTMSINWLNPVSFNWEILLKSDNSWPRTHHSSLHFFLVSTSAVPFLLAIIKLPWHNFSLTKLQLLGPWLGLVGDVTFFLFQPHCFGYQSGSELISKLF